MKLKINKVILAGLLSVVPITVIYKLFFWELDSKRFYRTIPEVYEVLFKEYDSAKIFKGGPDDQSVRNGEFELPSLFTIDESFKLVNFKSGKRCDYFTFFRDIDSVRVYFKCNDEKNIFSKIESQGSLSEKIYDDVMVSVFIGVNFSIVHYNNGLYSKGVLRLERQKDLDFSLEEIILKSPRYLRMM